jgi:hypothetical protein
MALETLKDVNAINGEKILQERALSEDGSIDWQKTDELRKESPIFVDHDVNMISFRIQNGPIKENGKNGCQVEDIIATAKVIIEGLNTKFPCRENSMVITKLDEAIMWSKKRTADRQARNVEGRTLA